MRAFHGDDDLKRKLLERLEAEIERGGIERAPNVRFDDRGRIMDALLPGEDAWAAEKALGIPASVMRLLDHFGGHIYFGSIPVVALARDFMAACAVGAVLDKVPVELVERMRAEPELRAVAALGASGGTLPSTVVPIDASATDEAVAFLTLASTVTPNEVDWTPIVDGWLHWRAKMMVRASGWSLSMEAEAEAELQRLWKETADDRRVGKWPDYPAMFRASNPRLAAGYEHALEVFNETYRQSAQRAVRWFLTAIAAAPVADTEA